MGSEGEGLRDAGSGPRLRKDEQETATQNTGPDSAPDACRLLREGQAAAPTATTHARTIFQSAHGS